MVTGLTVVLSGGHTYVGLWDGAAASVFKLKNAFELRTVPERDPSDGRVIMRVLPIMISPADEPVPEFYVRPDAYFDRSTDQGLISVYASLTGRSPILIPGLTR